MCNVACKGNKKKKKNDREMSENRKTEVTQQKTGENRKTEGKIKKFEEERAAYSTPKQPMTGEVCRRGGEEQSQQDVIKESCHKIRGMRDEGRKDDGISQPSVAQLHRLFLCGLM